MSKDYMISFDELDDILNDEFRLETRKEDDIDMPSLIEEIENLKNEVYWLKDENDKLKEELLSLQDELQAFYKMKLKDTSVRGSVWYLDSYEQEAIVIQTKFDSYMLLDAETYNRWYDEEFTRDNVITELIKRGWRIKK